MSPLSIFSGPYAFLARMGVFFLTLFIAIAFGFYEGWKWERPAVKVAQDKLTTFTAQVKTLGETAQKAADARKLADQQAKESTDAKIAAVQAAADSTIGKLRHDLATRTSGRYLPAAPVASSRPDLTCYDRAALESAIGAFIADARAIADSGTAATIDLNGAKEWASKTLH